MLDASLTSVPTKMDTCSRAQSRGAASLTRWHSSVQCRFAVPNLNETVLQLSGRLEEQQVMQ